MDESHVEEVLRWARGERNGEEEEEEEEEEGKGGEDDDWCDSV